MSITEISLSTQALDGTLIPSKISTNPADNFTFPGSVAISGSIAASAVLSLSSTTKGFLPPRMTTTQRDAIASPATGLEIYNTTSNQPEVYNGTDWVAMIGSNVSYVDDVFSAPTTGANQVFTLSETPLVNSMVVNHNGLVLRPTIDYTVSGTSLTIVEVVSTGEAVQAIYAVANTSVTNVSSLNGLSGNVTLVAGSNVTITPSGNTLIIASTGGGGGDITFTTISSNQAVSTPGYFYVTGSTTQIDLPPASTNSGKTYSFKGDGSVDFILLPDGSDLIDNNTSVSVQFNEAIQITSDGTNWLVLDSSSFRDVGGQQATWYIDNNGNASFQGVVSTGNIEAYGGGSIDISAPGASNSVTLTSDTTILNSPETFLNAGGGQFSIKAVTASSTYLAWPAVSTADRDADLTPTAVDGWSIYNADSAKLNTYNGTNSSWQEVESHTSVAFQTSDDTPITADSVTLVDNSIYSIETSITARDQVTGDSAMFLITAAYKRNGGTPVLVGSVNKIANKDDSGWDADLSPTGSSVEVTVTGDSANAVNWLINTTIQHNS